jgi:hypothetical protein
LEDFIVKDGDVFMVELRLGDKWPRDRLLEGSVSPLLLAHENWRSRLEVGDRVDIFDNGDWKLGIVQRVAKGEQLTVHLLNEHWKNDVIVNKDSGKVKHNT